MLLTTKQMYSICKKQFGVMSSPACRQAGSSEQRLQEGLQNEDLELKGGE
jgi:hypothetical protein